MSGIAVIHAPDGAPIAPEEMRSLLEAIEHAGTTQSTWHAPGIAIGERLLITTPEASDQRMPTDVARGLFQVALDGRLDNREDLLLALVWKAGDGTSPTDSDLIALAYEKWGNACARHLIGDFAFVLWDCREHRLYAARDQRGFRPLVYTRSEGRWIFGSEARQLLTFPGVSREIDHGHLAAYLVGAPTPQGSTAYAAVSEVPPGHYVTLEGEQLRLREYWRFGRRPLLHYRSRDDYVEHFNSVFATAVRAATRSIDTPGVLLSGGLDSSLLTVEAVRTAPELKAIHAYVDPEFGTDERPYARSVAQGAGIGLAEFAADDCWSLSSQYLLDSDFDQPELPMQAALMVKSAQFAATQGISVLLDGVGGDEFFTGRHTLASRFAGGHLLTALSEARACANYWGLSGRQVAFGEVLKPLVPEHARLLSRRLRGKPELDPFPTWIDPTREAGSALPPSLIPRTEPSMWLRQNHRDYFWELLRAVSHPHMAWRSRRAYLPNGIEARSPFFDLRVIEFYLQTPEWIHGEAGRIKALLRQAMRGRVPESVLERDDKALFDRLLRAGLVDREIARVEAAILHGPLKDIPYLRKEALIEDYEAYRRHNHPWWLPLWRAITAGLWLQSNAGSSHQTLISSPASAG